MSLFLLLLLALAPAEGAATPFRLNEQALALLERGEYDQAVALLEQAVKAGGDAVIVKNLAVAQNNRGLFHLREARFGAAVVDFEAAIRGAGDVPLFWVNLGYAHLLARDFARAEVVLRDARTRFPEEPKVYDFLGFLHYSKDELASAVEAFEARLELAPDDWALEQLERARREFAVSGDFVDRSCNDFTLKFMETAANHALADRVLGILDDARARVGSDLGHFPRERTTVLLYSAADFRKATGAHSWVGGLYDGKIRLPLNDFERQQESLGRTARHEYTHRVIADLAPSCPIWLNEGIAEWFEEGGRDSHRQIRLLAASGHEAQSFASLPKSLAAQEDAVVVQVQYAAARSFVAFLRERFGLGALRSLLQGLGRGDDVDASLRRCCGSDLEELEALWRREILR
ncbi:MAG: tetratricopeptide repeat protein [Planctomycetes bacterium]|nr:tetratricopeptide repeat protein [Planctomycetota bacterium]